jgi:hypothetical protein
VSRALACALLVAVGLAAPSRSSTPGLQALRTCIDRWNQGHMTGWGSMSARVAVRALDARERSAVSFGDDAKRRCTISLAGRPGDNSWICRIGDTGAYDCPLVTSDGMPRLVHVNGRTDRRGILTLNVPLTGTQPTPPLAWQRRYPHVDGYILPWTGAGRLRPGLRFADTERGPCGPWVEHRLPRSGMRCVDRRTAAYYEPCFVQGDVAACAGPGSTTFVRWRVSGRL